MSTPEAEVRIPRELYEQYIRSLESERVKHAAQLSEHQYWQMVADAAFAKQIRKAVTDANRAIAEPEMDMRCTKCNMRMSIVPCPCGNTVFQRLPYDG